MSNKLNIIKKSQISENYKKKINQQEILNSFNIAINQQLKEFNSSSETKRIISFNEWLGGLIDADGCFYISKKNYLSCEITLSKREVVALFKIKKIFGGKIEYRVKSNCYRWRLHKKELLIKFLKALNGNIYVKILKFREAFFLYINDEEFIFGDFMNSGAWFSGFMEGDGTFIIEANNNYSIFFCVSQKDKNILLLIKQKFGGEIYYDKSWKGYTWRLFNKSELFYIFLYFTKYPLKSLKNSDILTLKRFFRWKLLKYHLDLDKKKQLDHFLNLFQKRKKI